MSVNPIPEGYHTVTPYLVVDGAESAIGWYGRVFGAEETMRLPMGDRIGHAELRVGNSMVMLADEFPDMGILGPTSRGGPTSSLLLYVEDADGVFARAVSEGATAERPPEDQFWGDRMGTLIDPFGHRWSIATHKEDLSADETTRRMEEWSARQSG
ncbi:MAG TPA: VOC family protein [Allosphingosinicella sp.]|jgi:PhnB protein